MNNFMKCQKCCQNIIKLEVFREGPNAHTLSLLITFQLSDVIIPDVQTPHNFSYNLLKSCSCIKVGCSAVSVVNESIHTCRAENLGFVALQCRSKSCLKANFMIKINYFVPGLLKLPFLSETHFIEGEKIIFHYIKNQKYNQVPSSTYM